METSVKNSHMDPHKLFSDPKESVAPSQCAVVMTTYPHSTLFHIASLHPEHIQQQRIKIQNLLWKHVNYIDSYSTVMQVTTSPPILHTVKCHLFLQLYLNHWTQFLQSFILNAAILFCWHRICFAGTVIDSVRHSAYTYMAYTYLCYILT